MLNNFLSLCVQSYDLLHEMRFRACCHILGAQRKVCVVLFLSTFSLQCTWRTFLFQFAVALNSETHRKRIDCCLGTTAYAIQ